MTEIPGIDPTSPPSGSGCAACLAGNGWWFHLRRCAQCGQIGCCESSPAQHAKSHSQQSGHPLIQSFEPGETWFWSYPEEKFYNGPALAPPNSRPKEQPVPGPAGRVPADWRNHLH